MILSQNRIKYVLFHLSQHWHECDEVSDKFCFVDESDFDTITLQNKIIFRLSESETIEPLTINMLDSDIPILYSIAKTQETLFYLDANNNLIFTHDYLKSSFYLLSGLQEIETDKKDFIGRFPFSESIQKKVNCVTIPVVNYYFEIIIQGLELFCSHHKINFKRKRLFDNFGFFLSHDVDQIAFYHVRETAFKLKQLLGLSPLIFSKPLTFKLFLKGLVYLINPFPKKDPWWNFDEMTALEKGLRIRSAFYFLKHEHCNMDSRCYFDNPKIKTLIKSLKNDGFEVGLHGTILSAENEESLLRQTNEFVEIYGEMHCGIRQHFLRFIHPKTFALQQKAGFKYDTTLAFAEHDGYRNSYCYPFRPYDFENDKMFDIWEIPLTMMEVSVLNYRKLNFDGLKNAAFHLIDEAHKFGGLFSLLWHNSRLTEYEYPGVQEFYKELLEQIVEEKPAVFTGEEFIKLKVEN